jgi:hypothetical protein
MYYSTPCFRSSFMGQQTFLSNRVVQVTVWAGGAVLSPGMSVAGVGTSADSVVGGVVVLGWVVEVVASK